MKTEWVIEYWNNEEKKVECFSDKDGSWEDAPKENVLVVYISRRGVWPYGRPGKKYTQVMRGTDYYYFYERYGGAIFGMWNDDGRATVMNVWGPDGKIESRVVTKKPRGISDKIVKCGVWVEEPWASRLGLSTVDRSERCPHSVRTIKGCFDG